jgi:Trypsin Inhibitor like cysteine rich domain
MLQQILFQRVWNRNALIWTSLTGALKPIAVSRVYCFLLQIPIVFIQYNYVSAAECPVNEVFNDCFQHMCERSCSNIKQTCAVGNICRSGCFCKDGYVRKGDSCVLPSQCDDCIIVLNHIGFSGEELLSYDGDEVLMNNHGSYLASGANGEDGRRLFEVIVTKCKCDDQPGSACTQSMTITYQGNTINMRWTKEKVCSFI